MLWALQYIESGSYTASDLIEAMLTSAHGSFEYHARRIHREKLYRERLRGNERKKAAARFYMLCSRFRKDGFITEGKATRTMRLTIRGKLKMKALLAETQEPFPDPQDYAPAKGDQLMVFAFDIPEDERPKRDWLRETLARLGFTMKQQSFWMGRVKMPKEFLDDLDRLGLAQYVEIFAVTKPGSLQQIV